MTADKSARACVDRWRLLAQEHHVEATHPAGGTHQKRMLNLAIAQTFRECADTLEKALEEK
jgi:hypothetical protein